MSAREGTVSFIRYARATQMIFTSLMIGLLIVMDVYQKLGVRRVINANGTKTHLGGSIPDLRVMDSMKEASQSFVIMMELIEKAGKVIAEVTGAEAGIVTSGSSAAMTLAAAACIMKASGLEKFEIQPVERIGLDQEWRDLIQRLPDASWTRNEFVTQKMHRNAYDHAYKVAGGKIIEVGTSEGCSQGELEAAINSKTAGIAFTARVDNTPERAGLNVPLRKVVEIAQRHDVPVVVDAASELPLRSNIRKYIAEGADLVIYSGGKLIGGPNDTGILCGRKDLIKLATLQSAPYRGIGRGMKVDRTQIVGLITALRLWLEKDEEAEFKAWRAKARWIAEALREVPKILKSEVVVQEFRNRVFAFITLDARTAANLVFDLRRGDPSIWVGLIGSNRIEIDPSNLVDGEEKIVVSSIKKILKE